MFRTTIFSLTSVTIFGVLILAGCNRQEGASADPPAAPGDAHSHASTAHGPEGELYLTPGGLYTLADIEANGRQTGTEKFEGFRAVHDLKPKPGDKICPITLTKANPQVSWIIGGKTYEFCCPPCVDEFLALAKEDPDAIQDPGEYVKQ